MKNAPENSRKRKAAPIIAAVLLVVLLFDFLATKLVYDGIFSRYDAPAKEYPAAASYEDVRFFSRGNTLFARLYAPNGDPLDALVVVTPGMRAGFEDLMPVISFLSDLGFAVFAFDPTGCRNSGGESANGFIQGVYDLDACIDHIESCGRYGYSRLLLFGHSMGGFAVCCAATSGHELAGIVSVSAPGSAMEAVMAGSSNAVGKAAARANYPMLWLYQRMLFGKDSGLKAYDAVSGANVPVLIVQGNDDDVFTPDEYSVYSHTANLTSPCVRSICLEGGHTDLMFDEEGVLSPAFADALRDFMLSCVTEVPLG